jgi:alkylhydroperoxidase/carboxymuconolactone decarboxylase family protein YurZ
MDYLPEIYKEFEKYHPEMAEAYSELARRSFQSGPLDKKTCELVKLGIAIGLGSEGAVKSHARRALADGVSAPEVQHAVLLAVTTAGFPAMIAAMKWINEVIDKNK